MANVQSIITEAVYLSIQDRQFQPDIDAGYLYFGLNQLNKLLDGWRNLIPFASHVTFHDVDDLQNSTFISVDNVSYILNNVSYPLIELTQTQYTEVRAITNLTGIPQYYFLDQLTQSVEIYPRPIQPSYGLTVYGRIQTVTLGMFDTIPANMPPFMVDAVTYELAYRFAGAYGMPWDEKNESLRQTRITSLKNKKSTDLKAARELVFGFPGTGSIPGPPWLYYMSGGS